MAYYLDLFSPATHAAYAKSDRTTSGFRKRHAGVAKRVKPGDIFICYVTKVSRWTALLEVESGPFEDDSPRFSEQNDPFVIRFKVKPLVWLEIERSIPIHDERVWRRLSFTKDC